MLWARMVYRRGHAGGHALIYWYYSTVLFCSYHVTALYCAWCEMPRGVSYLSAKPKSSSYFGWLFIPNILLDINDGPGLAALYHRRRPRIRGGRRRFVGPRGRKHHFFLPVFKNFFGKTLRPLWSDILAEEFFCHLLKQKND